MYKHEDLKADDDVFTLYNVTITKVIESNQQLTKNQINALLQDPNVKSIHINK